MKESIVNAIVNLLKIKSLVTLALTFVFCFLSVILYPVNICTGIIKNKQRSFGKEWKINS